MTNPFHKQENPATPFFFPVKTVKFNSLSLLNKTHTVLHSLNNGHSFFFFFTFFTVMALNFQTQRHLHSLSLFHLDFCAFGLLEKLERLTQKGSLRDSNTLLMLPSWFLSSSTAERVFYVYSVALFFFFSHKLHIFFILLIHIASSQSHTT